MDAGIVRDTSLGDKESFDRDASGIRSGCLGIPLSRRRDPTDRDFSDPRFDVIWELIKRVDVDFKNGLFSGATGNDVCAILDELDASGRAKVT